MKIQKCMVKYKDRDDIMCTYGITEDSISYYFLDSSEEYKLANGNIIASTELIEAIDPMYNNASHVGLINEEGKVIIPMENKSIRVIADGILLVELAKPVSANVVEAIQMRSDPTLATKLVSTSALVKERLNSKMNGKVDYLFNNPFSEATICNLEGENLIDNQYYSFIAEADGKLYFSKNNVEEEIREYSLLPKEIQNNAAIENTSQEINVSQVQVSPDLVEQAMANQSQGVESSEKFNEDMLKENVIVPEIETSTNSTESVTTPVELVENASTSEEKEPSTPVESEIEEAPTEFSPIEEDHLEEFPEEADKASLEEESKEENITENEEEIEEPLKIAFEEEKEPVEEIEKEPEEQEEDYNFDDLIHITKDYDKKDTLKDFQVEDSFSSRDYSKSFKSSSDSIVSDVAKYMNALLEQNRGLIEQNEKLIKQNDQLKESLEKVLSSRSLLVDKTDMQSKKIEALTNKMQEMQVSIGRLEKTNREQEKVIEAQSRDRADLEKVLTSVREELGENAYSYDESFYSIR